MNVTYLKIEQHQDFLKINSIGDWTLYTEPTIEKIIREIKPQTNIVWDFSKVTSFDSAGVLLFIKYLKKFQQNFEVKVTGYTEDQERFYKLIKAHITDEEIPSRDKNILHRIGEEVTVKYQEFTAYLNFSGHVTLSFLRYFINPRNFRYKEMMYHIHKSGLNALLIVALTSFLVGLVISYQSAVQLAKFGAEIFIVDMAGISITRELAPMITAIVVAGRSGSAFTAQIGAMKITEEISAMRTMGFDPYYFLVLPRVLALMIVLPLLIFFADIIGIMGSMFAAKMELNISYTQFVTRLHEVLNAKHFWIGIIKGPIFAMLIALIGCFRGLQVSDDTESIGAQTTASVVNSIFVVIAFDALFSVLLTQWGI